MKRTPFAWWGRGIGVNQLTSITLIRIIICVNGRLSRLGRPHSEQRRRRDTGSGTHPDAVA
ncbi:hypothetical protein H7X46_11975 [Pseudonocardia sp. C8]|uniref:hypothetical protein n=1 Tax=Pseudonocardia sp. C8 TaxID=2762759 RepID=UPI0016427994|nr:hypothetical protein [Pseudonocardia sp. C8]MBC3191780.1 hypothetical protein [Pseudonocardia sp. C8]